MIDLANRINNFDFFYEMSDSSEVWAKGSRNENEIKKELDKLSNNELVALNEMINAKRDFVNRYFKNYFDNLEPVKVESRMSKVNKAAWYYFKKRIYLTWSECLKAAWKAIKLKAQLLNEKVKITFRKSSGEIREIIAVAIKNYNRKTTGSESYTPDLIKFIDTIEDKIKCARIERILDVAQF